MKIESIKKIHRLWVGIKNEIDTINGGERSEYGKDFMKIKFDTDDDLPLNQLLKLCMLTTIFTSAFKEDGKLYPQIYLDECLYGL